MKPISKNAQRILQGLLLLLFFLFSSCGSDTTIDQEPDIEMEDPPVEVIDLSDIFPRRGRLTNSQNSISRNQNGEYFLTGSDAHISGCSSPPPINYVYCESSGVFLYKFDSDGRLLWELNWEDEVARVVSATSDGGCYLGSTGSNMIIRKINAEGEVIWTKVLGEEKLDRLYNFTLNSDEEIICTGKTENFGAGGHGDIWTVQLSKTGEILWSETYSEEGQQVPSFVVSMSDNGFLVIGQNTDEDYKAILILLKYNQVGELLWVKNYQLNDWTVGTAALEIEDENVLITGRVYESLTSANLLLMKVDNQGGIIWNKEIDNFEGSETGNKIIQNLNGEIVVIGTRGKDIFTATFDQWGNQMSSELMEEQYIYAPTMVTHNDFERTIFYNENLETQDTVFEMIKYSEVDL